MGTRNKETQRRSMRIQPQRCSTQSCLAKPDLNSCSALGLLKAPRQQMHQQNSLIESDLELQLTTLKLRSWIYSFFSLFNIWKFCYYITNPFHYSYLFSQYFQRIYCMQKLYQIPHKSKIVKKSCSKQEQFLGFFMLYFIMPQRPSSPFIQHALGITNF